MINHYEVVKKLIGEIEPIGETQTDDTRFENLKQLCTLIDSLLFDINQIIPNSARTEHSMKRAGTYAQEFIKTVHDAF